MIVSIYITNRKHETLFQYSTVAECPSFTQLIKRLESKNPDWRSGYCTEINSDLNLCKYESRSNPLIYWSLHSSSESSVSIVSLLEELDLLTLQYFDKDQLSTLKINNNLDRLSMLFHCVFDGGKPVITDSNRLRAMVPAKNDLSKMLKTTTTRITKTLQQPDGSFFKSEVPGQSVGGYPGSPVSSVSSFQGKNSTNCHSVDESPVPWRMSGLNYANNELFVDMVEEINATLEKGKLITGNIRGQVELNSRISGMPLVEMHLDLLDHKLNHTNSTFHRCVIEDKANAMKDLLEGKFKTLTFVPPDGRFNLWQYTIPLTKRDANLGMVDVHLESGLGKKLDEFEIRVTVAVSTKVSEIEELGLTIKMNRSFKGTVRVMRNTHGGVETNMSRCEVNWHLDKNMVCGSLAVLRCVVEPEATTETEEISQHNAPSFTSPTSRSDLLKPKNITCRYQHKYQLPSGIQVKSIDVKNAGSNKPFKGVKYITRTGSLDFR